MSLVTQALLVQQALQVLEECQESQEKMVRMEKMEHQVPQVQWDLLVPAVYLVCQVYLA